MSAWDTLGVRPGAPMKEVTAAYRRMALKHHPDRGGKAEDFARVVEAYEAIKSGRMGSLDPSPRTANDVVRDMARNSSWTTVFTTATARDTANVFAAMGRRQGRNYAGSGAGPRRPADFVFGPDTPHARRSDGRVPVKDASGKVIYHIVWRNGGWETE